MNRIYIGLALVTLMGESVYADVVVYKETCGRGAFANWNLTCKITETSHSNYKANAQWTDFVGELQSITICASFTNRGELNHPTSLIYNYHSERQTTPMSIFETVKVSGDYVSNYVRWIGVNSRGGNSNETWSMRGELRLGDTREPFLYSEVLLRGRKQIRTIRATCRQFDD